MRQFQSAAPASARRDRPPSEAPRLIFHVDHQRSVGHSTLPSRKPDRPLRTSRFDFICCAEPDTERIIPITSLVAHLTKIRLEQANGAEVLIVLETDELIGLVPQILDVEVGATGTASTNCRGLRVRIACNAARMVAPVAIPSSITIATRSAIGARSRPAM